MGGGCPPPLIDVSVSASCFLQVLMPSAAFIFPKAIGWYAEVLKCHLAHIECFQCHLQGLNYQWDAMASKVFEYLARSPDGILASCIALDGARYFECQMMKSQ